MVAEVALLNREETVSEVSRVSGPRVNISTITREQQEVGSIGGGGQDYDNK